MKKWSRWSQTQWAALSRRFDRASTGINNTPWKRRTAIAGFCTLYVACGWAGWRYLQDTRYKATGEPNPYRRPITDSEPSPANGPVAPHDTTPVYEELASEYDKKIGLEEIASYVWWMRRRLGKHVKGDALEVACGTGRNLGWLSATNVSSLTLLDSSLMMLEVAKDKFDTKYAKRFRSVPTQFVKGRAEDLVGLTNASAQRFDTVYESFGLCSHEDPDKALAEMAALVKPGGRIVLLEHGRGTYESMNKRMDARAEERAKEWGCRWNLDIAAIVKQSGLSVLEEDRYHFGTIYFYVLQK